MLLFKFEFFMSALLSACENTNLHEHSLWKLFPSLRIFLLNSLKNPTNHRSITLSSTFTLQQYSASTFTDVPNAPFPPFATFLEHSSSSSLGEIRKSGNIHPRASSSIVLFARMALPRVWNGTCHEITRNNDSFSGYGGRKWTGDKATVWYRILYNGDSRTRMCFARSIFAGSSSMIGQSELVLESLS